MTLDGTGDFSGVIKDGSGVLSVVKGNFSLVTLTGASTYSGGTTINNGELSIGNMSALGTGAVTFNQGVGGVLESTVTGSFAHTINLTAGVLATIEATAGHTLTLTGAFNADGGPGTTLHFGSATDAGTVVLDAGGSYVAGGSLSVDGGTLVIGAAAASAELSNMLGLFVNTHGTVQVNTGATLDIDGNSLDVASLSGAGVITNNGAAATFGDWAYTNQTFSGSLQDGSGALGLFVAGGGVLTLTGANSYSGGTNINWGEISLGNITALGTGAVTFTYAGSTLESTVTGTLANSLNVAAGETPNIEATAGHTLTLTGGLNVEGGAGTTLNFGSTTDSGTVVLDAGGSFVAGGSWSVDGGTLVVGDAAADTLSGILGLFVNTHGTVQVNTGATLDTDGNSLDVASLSGAGVITNNGAAATFGDWAYTNQTFSGSLQDGSGALGLFVAGGGVLTLTGANSYSGGTNINWGEISLAISRRWAREPSPSPMLAAPWNRRSRERWPIRSMSSPAIPSTSRRRPVTP